jgi:ribosomally synthesized peptide (two-chain TOMM family)
MASAISSSDSYQGVEKVSATNTASGFVQQFGKIWPQCIARAWQDAAFREALKRDPVGTIQSSYQFAFPQGFKLEITETDDAQQAASADTLRMVIPPPPAGEMGEIALTDVSNGINHGPKPPRPLTLSFTC